VLRLRPLAFATSVVWRLRIGACGVGACGFWRLWQLPEQNLYQVVTCTAFISFSPCPCWAGLGRARPGQRGAKRNKDSLGWVCYCSLSLASGVTSTPAPRGQRWDDDCQIWVTTVRVIIRLGEWAAVCRSLCHWRGMFPSPPLLCVPQGALLTPREGDTSRPYLWSSGPPTNCQNAVVLFHVNVLPFQRDEMLLRRARKTALYCLVLIAVKL